MANIINIFLPPKSAIPLNPPENLPGLTTNDSLIISAPISEDIKIDIKSSYTKAGEALSNLPLVGSPLASVAAVLTTANTTGKSYSEGFRKNFEALAFESADPIKLNVTLTFYTRYDPFYDVIWPTWALCSLGMITPYVGGVAISDLSKLPSSNLGLVTWRVPGYTGGNARVVPGGDAKIDPVNAKVFSVEIPGAIRLQDCLMEAASPTFSKEVVRRKDPTGTVYLPQAFPLYSKVELSISTAYPSTTAAILPYINALEFDGITDSVFKKPS